MTIRHLSALVLALALALPATATANPGHKITFNSPAPGLTPAWTINDFSAQSDNADQAWERLSLPIGNGSFGATVFGGVETDRLVLNEKSLWKGGPATSADYWQMNREVPDSVMAHIRALLAEGKNREADSIVSIEYRGTKPYDRTQFGTFTVLGEAQISTGVKDSDVKGYVRALDIDRSLAEVSFTAGGTKYERQFFASYPDSMMVWRFKSSNKPQTLGFRFITPQPVDTVMAVKGGLLFVGHLEGNGMRWAMRVMARGTGKCRIKVHPDKNTIDVSGSKDIEFLLAAKTDYRLNLDPDFNDPRTYTGADPVAAVNKIIEHGAAMPWDALYRNHYADYAALFNRVKFSLNPDAERPALPTDERLHNYRKGTADPGLEELYFNYGRYLLISSSRAGSLPANLQGLWHNNTDGPWRVDYHNNINVQMNYWPATNTNLAECFVPFSDYVCSLMKPGAETASKYYGARGWTAEVSSNPFGFTAPLDSYNMSWNYNPTAGPWLASQLWEYYDFTRDKDWLRRTGWPVIKGAADFVSDILVEHDGYLTSAPSYSPEHGTADIGATYANAVTREVLKAAVEAAHILGTDSAKAAEWSDKLARILPYRTGRHGQLREWYEDIDDPTDQHRHTNHLFGLHPGTTINSLTDTTLVAAAKETLRERGDAATGWSMGWKLNHWARLLDGDHAYILLRNLLSEGTADNMWDLHPPFQIDGNFGGTAGMAELLLQGHNGVIHLLPALPSAWKSGSMSGLKARGNFEVSLDWTDNALTRATVRSLAGAPCTVLYKGERIPLNLKKGETATLTFSAGKSHPEVSIN